MMKTTNCPNCGAPVDLAESCCPYCDTPYISKVDAYTPMEDKLAIIEELNRKMAAGILTGNEARALLGLPPV